MRVEAVIQRVRELEIPGYGDDEVSFMAETVFLMRPAEIFDWGTNVGSSARIFYEAVAAFGLDCKVHTFELPIALASLDRDHPGERVGLYIRGVPVQQHFGDGLYSALLVYALNGKLRALFFLDGCHKPGVVLHELESIEAMVPDAAILVHDTRELTGGAIAEFLWERVECVREDVPSQAGMTRLWLSQPA